MRPRETESPTRRVELKLRDRRPAMKRARLSLQVHAGDEAVSNFLREYGIWQRSLAAFAGWFLRRGDVVVDVGAHIGYFAVAFANSVWPEGRVYAFEADPINFHLLERNRALNGFELIDCRAVAISERSGELGFHRSATKSWGGSLVAKPMHSERLTVPSLPLDEALAEEKRPVRLIKIDVEGGELRVLKGLEQLLRRPGPKPALIVEFSPPQIESEDPGMTWLLQFIARHGFEIRPFISHEAPSVVPPRIAPDTLARIYRDFLDQGATAELDLLLATPGSLGRAAGG